MDCTQAFVATSGISLFSGTSVLPRTCAATTSHTPRLRHASITMQERKTAGKKKAATVFALDIKGNFVWTLRSASNDDVEGMSEILGPNLPTSIISSLVSDSPCCTICEASVKGAKEGDGFSGCIMGCAIVDVGVNLSTEKPTKWGDVITVAASPELPNIGDVKKKLLLGSLKKMKEEGVSEVSSGIPEDKVDRISLLENCLFQVKERANGMVSLKCQLSVEDPDPEKKML